MSIRFRDFLLVNELSKSKSKLVLTVVLPDTSEVGFVRNLRRHLMREDDIVFLKNLRGKFA